MVIQRWQSAWLFSAAVFMIFYLIMPMFVSIAPDIMSLQGYTETIVYPIDATVYFIVCALTALLLFVDIFLYKNLSLQKTLALIAIFLILAVNITCWILYVNFYGTDTFDWQPSIFMQYGAFIFAILAWYRIRKDQQLLASADRLR